MKGIRKDMNKTEMISVVAEKIEGATKKDIAVVVDTVFETIKEVVASGEKVQLVGFGNFEVTERAARTGRNPQTGQTIEIAASKSPKFKAGKAFKDIVNA